MKKADLCILIIEDDLSLGAAIEAGVKKLGYKSRRVKSANEAKTLFDRISIEAIITDCMLPDRNAVDLISELQKQGYTGPVILTSGVFKDSAFKQGAMLKTKAIKFFHKPFDLEELLLTVDEQLSLQAEDSVDPLFMYLKQQNSSDKEKINSLNESGRISAYHLPLVYSIMAQSKLTGRLEINYEDETKAVLSYIDGNLISMESPDVESYFGTLLIENGFCTQEEVSAIVAQKTKKRIGEKLVDASFLSPHVIEIIQNEQALLRISKSISQKMVNIKFSKESITDNGFLSIDNNQIIRMSVDWISSKIDPPWLLQFYSRWMNYNLEKGASFNKLPSYLQGGFLNTVDLEKIKALQGMTLQEIFEVKIADQETLLPIIHFLLLQKIFVLGNSEQTVCNFNTHESRLKKIEANMQNQSDFEVLGVTKLAKPSEVQKAYQELAKIYHPDKLPPDSPTLIKKLTQSVFARITEAHQTLSSASKRKDYIRKLELGEAEEILAAESRFEDAQNMLKAGRLRDARKAFETCLKMRGHRSDTYIYLSWALLLEKRAIPVEKRHKLTDLVASYISKVPHEDRHSPPYFFTRGLLYEAQSKPEKARACFRSCLALDENFIEAKREMQNLYKKYGKAKSKNFGELSQMFSSIFKTKAG